MQRLIVFVIINDFSLSFSRCSVNSINNRNKIIELVCQIKW